MQRGVPVYTKTQAAQTGFLHSLAQNNRQLTIDFHRRQAHLPLQASLPAAWAEDVGPRQTECAGKWTDPKDMPPFPISRVGHSQRPAVWH